jgi:sugar lactone lactonase YvrE
LSYPLGIALDGAGNLYIADYYDSRIRKVSATAAAMGFPNTYVGSQSMAQTGPPYVFASNIGNAALALTNVGTTTADYTTYGGSCYSYLSMYSTPSADTQVPVGDSCVAMPECAPAAAGSRTDNLVFTDNSLNASGSTQQVSLSGTALQVQQTITFTNPGVQSLGVAPITLSATATSGLPVTLTLVSGLATLNGNTLTITGAGTIVLQADQTGNNEYSAATSVQVSLTVNPSVLTANVGSTSTNEGINFVFASADTGIHVQVVTTGIPSLYFKDAGTGTCDTNGTAHSYSAGGSCTVFVDFQPAYPGQWVGAVRLIDSTGAAVATQLISGTSTSAELVAWPGVLSTVAGTGNYGNFGDSGAAISASLGYPGSVAVDAAGNLYIADYGNSAIRRVDATTQTITTVAGNGDNNYSGDNGPAIQASLNSPWWVSIDGAGNLYIADSSNNVIRKVDAVTQTITTVAGNGTGACGGDGGLATSAQLNNPQAVVVDASGNIYIADADNNRVRKVDAATQTITTVAGNGTNGYSGDGGPAASAGIGGLWTIALDGAGNLYIVDGSDSVIRKVDASTQKITTVAGNGTSGYGGDGGPATGAELNTPSAVAVDAAGNIYIADYSNNLIRKVDAATQTIFSVAGSGSCQSSTDLCGDGGAALEGDFNGPSGVTLDGAGNLYIADGGNNRIRKVSAAAASLNFPTTYVTQQSSSREVFASNIGNSTLSLASVASSSADFGLTAYGNCQSTTQLNAGASCTTSVDFKPTMAGNLSSYLIFTDNALLVTGST